METLKQQILDSIKKENLDETHVFTKNIDFTEEITNSYMTFKDVLLHLKGFTWESYISFDMDAKYSYTKDAGDHDNAPEDEFKVYRLDVDILDIVIDGLTIDIAKNDSLKKEVKEKLKSIIEIKIE